MGKINIEELKTLQLDILVAIDKFCKENRLTWWLDYGTLIGAVRHKGYIPWDDDIDIGMPQKDYDYFVHNFNKSKEQRYIVECPDLNNSFPWTFAKIYDMKTTMYEPDEKGYKFHVFVDLFVYDNAPDDNRSFELFHKRISRLNSLHTNQVGSYIPGGNPIRKSMIFIARRFLHLFPRGFFWRRLDRARRKYNSAKTSRIVCYSSKEKPVPINDMVNTVNAQFESYVFPIPKHFEEHILGCYGFPYYELPPVEKRVNKHHFVAYFNE